MRNTVAFDEQIKNPMTVKAAPIAKLFPSPTVALYYMAFPWYFLISNNIILQWLLAMRRTLPGSDGQQQRTLDNT